MSRTVQPWCEGERCLTCGEPAVTKIEEVTEEGHPCSAYLCELHRDMVLSHKGKAMWLALKPEERATQPVTHAQKHSQLSISATTRMRDDAQMYATLAVSEAIMHVAERIEDVQRELRTLVALQQRIR